MNITFVAHILDINDFDSRQKRSFENELEENLKELLYRQGIDCYDVECEFQYNVSFEHEDANE